MGCKHFDVLPGFSVSNLSLNKSVICLDCMNNLGELFCLGPAKAH